VWDAESGAPLFKFQVKSGALTTVAVSPKGQYVAGGSVTGEGQADTWGNNNHESHPGLWLVQWCNKL
jgi:hypothetical protein